MALTIVRTLCRRGRPMPVGGGSSGSSRRHSVSERSVRYPWVSMPTAYSAPMFPRFSPVFRRSLTREKYCDDSPRLKPGAAGLTLVCRPTPLVRVHPVERTFLTDSPLGWHLFNDVAACTRRND